MRFHLKKIIVAASISAMLVLIWILASQYNAYAIQDEYYFEEQYNQTITALNQSINSVEQRFRQEDSPLVKIEFETPLQQAERISREASLSAVSLQGISWNLDCPLVLLNNKLYQTGDAVNGYTIEKILPDRIVVRNRLGKEKQIKLREDSL